MDNMGDLSDQTNMALGRAKTHYNRRLIGFAAGINFIVFYVELMLLPSLPAMATEYQVTIAQVGLVTALYAMSGTALVPAIGKLGDIFGKKKILVYVLAIYAASITLTGISTSFTFLLISRTIQGIGMSIQPLLISLVREEFPRNQVPKAQGILSGMSGAGMAVALPLGSLISDKWGWQTTYYTAIPFAIMFVIFSYLIVRESPYRRPTIRVDYIGSITIGASLAAFIFALAEAPSWGWISLRTGILAISGILLLLMLLLYDRRYLSQGGEPILNLKLLSIRNVKTSNFLFMLTNFAMILSFQAFVFKFELPFPAGFSLSVFQAGVSIVPLGISVVVFSPVAGYVVSKIGVKPVSILGAAVSAVGFLLCSQSATYLPLVALMFVSGAGLSLVNSSAINLLVLTVDPNDMGFASSMNSVFRNLGNSIGTPIAGSILSTFVISAYVNSKTISLPSSSAFHLVFYLAAIAFVATAILALVSKEVLGKGESR